MELKQLTYFCQIVRSGSISEAARHLHMSQPPLSYQIHQLEAEMGTALFQRSSQGVSLTEAGKVLYNRAGDLLRYAASTRLEVEKAGQKRILRIGITPTTVGIMLPYIRQFVQKHPDVNFEVRDGISISLFHDLLDGVIDISVVRTPLHLEEVESACLGTEPMIAVSAARQGGVSPIGLEALTERPLILYRRYEALVLDAFRAKGLEPELFCICDDPRDAVLWAEAGLATAVFPQSMERHCRGLTVQTLQEAALETQILLIWKKGRRPVPVVQDFLALCFPEQATAAE